MRIKQVFKVLLGHYKRDLVKNLSNSLTWLGLLFILVKLNESIHTQSWWLLGLEGLVAVLHPLAFIISVFSSTNRKLTLNEINQLSSISNGIIKQKNDQKFFSLLAYMRRNNRVIREINKGIISLIVHQNYQYARRVFESVLKGVVKEGGHYITLSSLSFWGKEPWHNNSTRVEYISMNLEEVGNGKYIRRIIAVDKDLLLSESQIKKTYQATAEKIKQLLADKETLKNIVSDFKKSKLMSFRKYEEKLFTLVYAVTEKELAEMGAALATVLVINENLTELVFITTTNLTASEKNAQIKGIYTKIDGGLKNKPGMSYDTKHLLNDIHDEFTATKTQGKIIFPEGTENKSGLKADCHFIINKYKEVFDLIHVNSSGEFKSEAGMYTIEKLAEILNV